MKNIIITGATGFLGQNLVAELKKGNNRITALNSHNCDLRFYENLMKFNECKYDEIYHLAAWTQAGDFCLFHPGEQWIINQKINTNILEWWAKEQPQAKMICMGTSCAYGPELPLEEKYYLTGKPIDSLFTYAMTKKMLYSGLLALNKQYGLNYMCFVPSTLYGAGYHTDGRQMHFIFDLIRKIIKGKYCGTQVSLWGNGYQKRELVLVSDFIKIMLKINDTTKNELVNIGAGQEYTIREFAGYICEIVGYDKELIDFDESKYTGAKSKCLSVEKMNNLLPNVQMTPLKEGLETAVKYFMDNKETIIKL